MPKFRNFQTNFSGGLLSEGMLGRVDLAQYENGCRQLDNWWPKVTGGARRRPGTLALHTTGSSPTRIESFIFNEDQTYIVAFCPEDEGSTEIRVHDPVTGNILATFNYAALTRTVIAEMAVTQRADVMILAHADIQPLKIIRTGAANFTLEAFNFENWQYNNLPKASPFIKFADPDITLEANGHLKNNIVTLTTRDRDGTEHPYFVSDHVFNRIKYRGKQLRISSIPATQPSATCQAVVVEELDRGALLTFNSSVDSPEDFEVGEIVVGRDSGIKAEVISTLPTSTLVAMIAGVFPAGTTEQIEGLDSGNIATITGKTDTVPPASIGWTEEAFNNYRGWPSVIEFHSQRLWLGGSSSLPAHIFGSRVAAFFNFDVGDAFAADSIQALISGNQINEITGLVSGRHLQVFTDGGEFYAPQSEDRPLVPETFNLLPQTHYGSKRNRAKVFDESTLFIQAQGNAVREFIWRDSQRGYSSDAISLIAEEHLNNVQEVEVLYGGYDRPEQIAFFVNGDGTITWYHAARVEQIRSWGKWTTQGNFKSLTVLQDKLYALVERNIGGIDQVILERFELDVTVDCAEQDTSTATDTWVTAHGILLNEQVEVVTGVQAHDPDFYLGSFALANGLLQLPIPVDNITVGLSFTQTLETMPIEVQDRNGVTSGMPKRIVSADIYMASTLAIMVNGNRVITVQGDEDLEEKPVPITGVRKFYLFGYSERPTIVVENKVPVPCEALSIGAEVEY